VQVGVGTSLLQAQMVQQGGYQSILSVDISSVAIKHMQQMHSHIPQLQYRVGDARRVPLPVGLCCAHLFLSLQSGPGTATFRHATFLQQHSLCS
jgi:hypothetical protein